MNLIVDDLKMTNAESVISYNEALDEYKEYARSMEIDDNGNLITDPDWDGKTAGELKAALSQAAVSAFEQNSYVNRSALTTG